jgi:Tripartite tricarboxylate transporter TctB family
MDAQIRSSQDFWTGVVFTAFGTITAVLSAGYPLGSASRMGPGYFPMLLGVILALIGISILVRSFTSGEGGHVGRLHIWPLVRLLLSIVAFGLLLNPLGLIVAAFVTVLIAAWAGPEFKPGEAILTALVLSLGSWIVFVVALKQTMPLWPEPLVGFLGL